MADTGGTTPGPRVSVHSGQNIIIWAESMLYDRSETIFAAMQRSQKVTKDFFHCEDANIARKKIF